MKAAIGQARSGRNADLTSDWVLASVSHDVESAGGLAHTLHVLVDGLQWLGGVVVAYAVSEVVQQVRDRGRYPQPQGGDALAVTALGLGLIVALGVLSFIYVLPRFDDGSLIGLAITLGVPTLVGLAVQSSVWRAVCRRRDNAATAEGSRTAVVHVRD